MNSFIAKTYKENDIKYKGYTVYEHGIFTGRIAQLLQKVKKGLHLKDIATTAALHDIGKMSDGFQDYILNDGERFDHTLCGWYHLRKQFPIAADVALNHHGPHGDSCREAPRPIQDKKNLESRNLFVDEMQRMFGKLENFSASDTEKKIIAGAVQFADHLASSIAYFEDEQDRELAFNNVVNFADLNNLKLNLRENLSFEEVCSFPPRGSQKIINDLDIKDKHTFVIKDDMGSGKTAMALMLAYRIMSELGKDGVYFALPTRTTSGRAYGEILRCIQSMIGNSGFEKLRLMHSMSHIDPNVPEQLLDWYSTNKRKALYPVGVGVVDFILKVALQASKDSNMLLYALSQKVIIVDEVHCYDAYMNVLLKSALNMLREAGCVIIILSATLTKKNTDFLIESKGMKPTTQSDAYPCLISVSNDGTVQEIATESSRKKKIAISMVDETDTCIEICLRKAMDGQQVAIIMNTVGSSQEVYRKLAGRCPDIEVGLLHSNFTQSDRLKIEEHWMHVLSKDCPKRYEKGRILVGTQVIEQSLNFDVDFMATMIAPIDLILQRSGRLWRFENTFERHERAKYELMVIAYEDCHREGMLTRENGFSVYFKYLNERTRQLLRQLTEIRCPEDNMPFCEYVYHCEEGCPDTPYEYVQNDWMIKVFREMEQEINKQQKKASNASVCLKDVGDDGMEGRTRDVQEKVSVLVVREIREVDGSVDIVLWSGEKVHLPGGRRKDVCEALTKNIVNVSFKKSPTMNFCTQEIAMILGRYIYIPKDNDGNYNLNKFYIFPVNKGVVEMYDSVTGYSKAVSSVL